MILCIAEVLSSEQLSRIRTQLSASRFQDGKETAGWHARLVKQNEQAAPQEPEVQALKQEVEQSLGRHPLFQMAARPKRVSPILFSRYRDGMTYGNHVDDPVMGRGDERLRSDLSVTLFLTGEEDDDGGELVMDTSAGEQSYKLPAGSMILYPSSTLHRVEPVTRGERLVAVGWVQSLIRDPGQREILFDLDTARRQLFEQQGKTREFDLLSKSLANLQRLWVEL